MKRVITAAVLLPLFIAAVLAENPLVFDALVMVAVVLCATEMERLAAAAGLKPFPFLGPLWAFALVASAAWPQAFPLDVVLAAGFVVLAFFMLLGGRDMRGILASSAVAVLTAGYTGFLIGHAIRIHDLGWPEGPRLIFLMALIVWTGDSAAYYAGSLWGKHKMAPRISPKKSWEGAVANVIGGILGAAVARGTFFPELPWVHALVLGVLLTIIGQAGDLVESAWKRDAGVKDSGSLLPGHGGLLDRLDSFILSAPALYFYHRMFMS